MRWWRSTIRGVDVIGILLLFGTIVEAGESSAVTDTRQSKFAILQPVGLEEVQWTRKDSNDGFWANRFETLRTRSIPAMWEVMRGTRYKPYLQHFLIAAGDLEGEYHGAQWNDGDFYKFLESVCATYAVTRDSELRKILDESIEAIGRAQRPDGYIHTPVLIRVRNGERDAQPFQDRHNFEMYNMGHLITTACVHRRVTGSEEFRNIARKTGDFLCDTFRDPTPELARNSVCPSHYMAMIELYRTTREPRYLQLAQTFLEMRELVEDGGDDNQDRIPFVDQREAVGHAVRANYLYAGAADLYLETGDPQWRTPLEPIWKSVVEKKMYITGGCGALYDGASPDGSDDQTHITRVHQSYGRNFQLPSTTAHNETCAAIGSVLWNWRMFLASGESRFVDVMELALYNAVLAGISLDGAEYFYVNPLRNVEPLPTELRWPRTRVPFMTSYCCPPNLLRTIAEVNAYVYSKSDDAIWVNLYGANVLSTTLNGKQLKLSQSTNYPWDGRVRIRIDECPADEFALKLRIPGWADSAKLQILSSDNSREVELNGYAEIRRRWKAGDTVELELNMVPKLMESHPLVEESRNHAAIQCGPIVYCLESPDLPKGVRVPDVVIPRDSKLKRTFASDLLQGIAVIEAEVLVRTSPEWEDRLYRPLETVDERKIKARFIPYYAWANRGKSEMSVWIPTK